MGWSDITKSDEFQSLRPDEQQAIKVAYYEKHVAPLTQEAELANNERQAVFQAWMNKPDDSGQSYFTGLLSSAGRGFASALPGAVGGLGYLTGSEDLIAAGKDIEENIEGALPINPIHRDSFGMKAAGAVGQAGSMLVTGGIGGATAKALAGVNAIKTGAQTAALGSSFLSGAREGGQDAERYGMTGGTAYARALGGGLTELATEKMMFGLGSETAAARKILGDTLEKGAGGFAKAVGTEAGEEAAAQIAGNIQTSALAPQGVQTPGVFSGAGEAAALGAVGGSVFGGINALAGTEPSTIESGEIPIPEDLQGKPKALRTVTIPGVGEVQYDARAIQPSQILSFSPDEIRSFVDTGKVTITKPEVPAADPVVRAVQEAEANVQQQAAIAPQLAAAVAEGAQEDQQAIVPTDEATASIQSVPVEEVPGAVAEPTAEAADVAADLGTTQGVPVEPTGATEAAVVESLPETVPPPAEVATDEAPPETAPAVQPLPEVQAEEKAEEVAIPRRVRVAGEEYNVVARNKDGTLRLSSDGGEFDTLPDEQWTEISAAKPPSIAVDTTKVSRDQFIADELKQAKFRKDLAILEAENAIRRKWTPPKKLPVGANKIQAFLLKARYTPEEKELLRDYNAAHRMVGGDAEGIARDKGAVWDELNKRQTTTTKALPAVGQQGEGGQGIQTESAEGSIPTVTTDTSVPPSNAESTIQIDTPKGLIAESEPKPRMDINNGTHQTQFRIRHFTDNEAAEMPFLNYDRFGVERRSVRTDNETGKVEYGEWSLFAKGGSKRAAIEDATADSTFARANSRDAVFGDVVAKETATREWKADKAKRLSAALEESRAAENEALRIKEEANKKYNSALKRAGLDANSDSPKVKAIQDKLLPIYKPQFEAAQEAVRAANELVKSIEAEKQPTSAPSETPTGVEVHALKGGKVTKTKIAPSKENLVKFRKLAKTYEKVLDCLHS